MPRWIVTTALASFFFGVNAAFIEIPEKFLRPPFPTTLGYVVWSVTMLACGAFSMSRIHWALEVNKKATLYGATVGLLGAGGQILLFAALRDGPAYIVVPVASLYPVITVILAIAWSREYLSRIALVGIALASMAILLLSTGEPDQGSAHGWRWLVFSILTLLMWGLQAWLIKASAGSINEESLFFYMSVSSLLLAPAAIALTDFTRPVNWTTKAIGLTTLIQLPNAVAALLQIYAYREGKVAIVAPMIALYPIVTIVLSLCIYRHIPDLKTFCGMTIALLAIYLMVRAENSSGPATAAPPATP